MQSLLHLLGDLGSTPNSNTIFKLKQFFILHYIHIGHVSLVMQSLLHLLGDLGSTLTQTPNSTPNSNTIFKLKQFFILHYIRIGLVSLVMQSLLHLLGDLGSTPILICEWAVHPDKHVLSHRHTSSPFSVWAPDKMITNHSTCIVLHHEIRPEWID